MRYESGTATQAILKQRADSLILRATFFADSASPSGAGAPSVLLTGFGSFTHDESGKPLPNITQTIITSLMKDRPGILSDVDLHLAVSATDWLAPIRFHQLAAEIGPDIIINLGQGGPPPGGTRIETGALNSIGSKRDEFSDLGIKTSDGALLGDQLDSSMKDLPLGPDEIELSWSRHVRHLEPSITSPSARPENTYICNATAWILAASIEGRQLNLFDGAFTLNPLPAGTLHGFLHVAQVSKLQNSGDAGDAGLSHDSSAKHRESAVKLIQRLISKLAF